MRHVPPAWVLGLGAVLAFGACKPKDKGGGDPLPATLPTVTLPADDLEAARAVGVAAATEKDPAKLAATLVAFLDRLHVPVVSEKWDKLLATGPKPSATSPWLWEPVLVGLARGTTQRHRTPFVQVMAAFLPKADLKKLAKLDFADFVQQIAKAATREPGRFDGPLATAIAEDLRQRKDASARPALDPTATLLLGLLLIAEQEASKAIPPHPPPTATAAPQFPGLPPGLPYVIPSTFPRRPQVVHAFDNPGGGGAVASVCAAMAQPLSWSATAFTGGTSAAGYTPSSGPLSLPPAVQKFLGEIADVIAAASIAGNIGDGIAGMGIAAFVTTDGNVSPTSVQYGDGPVTFTVNAKSSSPFTKDELSKFVDCLEATIGTAVGLDSLRDLPPAGGVPNLPVMWVGTSAFAPRHGTFTPSAGGGGGGLAATALSAGMSAVGGGTTDASGQAKATFQVKPKKGDQQANTTRHFDVQAEIFQYPVGTSTVYAGANLLFHQSVPLALEIKIPFDAYTMTLTWSDHVQTPGTTYFQDDGQAQVRITVDGGTLAFHGKGTGTHTYSMPSQGTGFVTCSAPVGGQPVDVQVDGTITDVDTMQAQMHVKVTPQSNTESMTIRCTPQIGHASTRQASAITGSISSGTELESGFTMKLDDGEEKSMPTDKSGGPMSITGTANIVLAADKTQ